MIRDLLTSALLWVHAKPRWASVAKPRDPSPFSQITVRFPTAAAVSGRVTVDGHDLSHAIRELHVKAVVGELVEVSMVMYGHLFLEADAEVLAKVLSLEDMQREAEASLPRADAPHAAGYDA